MKILLLILSTCLLSCAGVQPRYHRVEKGETLAMIASAYEISVNDLKEKNRDTLRRGVRKGQKLYIPFEENAQWNAPDAGSSDREIASARVTPASYETVQYKWPVLGPVSSAFGPRRLFGRATKHHEGIDIVAPRGTPVRAARSGHVIYAGNRISGYGNLVIIRHIDRFSTVYGHLSKMNVRKGQFVSRGQRIGAVGRTGRATGNHVHFEIRDRQSPVDPLLYLQGQYADNRVSR